MVRTKSRQAASILATLVIAGGLATGKDVAAQERPEIRDVGGILKGFGKDVPTAAPERVPVEDVASGTAESADKIRLRALQERVKAAGYECSEPTFEFEWIAQNSPVLVAQADPPGVFRATGHIAGGGKSKEGDSWKFDVTIQATKEGGRIDLPALNRQEMDHLLRRNGWVHLEYRELDETGKEDATEVCGERMATYRTLVALERHTLGIDAGPVLSLKNDGSWKTSPELAMTTASRWRSRWSGFTDLRYSFIAPVDEKPPAAAGATPGGTTGGTSGTTKEFPNPFESGGGTLRSNFYLGWHPKASSSFAVLGGFGVGTVPDSAVSELQAKGRVFAGVRLGVAAYNAARSADYFGNASGFVQFGVAYDDLWKFRDQGADGKVVERDERERFFIEGQLRMQDAKDRAVSLSPRIHIDLPTSGNGPSDIRVSLLASIKLERLRGWTGGLP
jgi:hypothetical protein